MTRIFIFAIAGGAGTLSRDALGGWVHRLFGAGFPFGTFAVTAIGCFLIGFLGTLLDKRVIKPFPPGRTVYKNS